jgi:hypothetical protein
VRRLALPFAAVFALACQPPPSRATEASSETSKRAPATTPTGDSDSDANAESPAPAPGDQACAVAPLRAELASYCEFDLGVPPIELPQVSWTAESYHPLATRVITLDRGGLTDPEGEGTVAIQAWLADPPRRLPEPGAMVLAIAEDVPATSVAELVHGLAAAGRQEIRVLVHVSDPRPLPQPRNPEMLADMAKALPASKNDRVMFVAGGIRGYAQHCPALAGVFGELAKVGPGERCPLLAERASAALVECGCPQLPDIMTLLYALTMGFVPPSGRAAAVPIRLDPEHAIRPAPGSTWGDVARAELKGTHLHPLWLDAAASPAPAE